MLAFRPIRTTRVQTGVRHLAVATLVAALAGALLVPVVSAGQAKLLVCHARGNGSFGPVVVAQPAYQSHLDHGDGEVGGPVPGSVGHVFDEECLPELAARPLLRVTSVDESGVEHLVAQWEVTNGDGLPSTGDTIRTGEFPLFTDTSGARTYVPATVTEHPNVVVTFFQPGPGWIALDATTATGIFIFYFTPEYEYFAEYGSDNFGSARALDTINRPYDADFTTIWTTPHASPSEPAIEPGVYLTSAHWSVDLLQITLYGTWFVAP